MLLAAGAAAAAFTNTYLALLAVLLAGYAALSLGTWPASGDPGQPIAFQWPGFIPVGTEIEVRIAAGKSTVEISPAEVDRQVVFPD